MSLCPLVEKGVIILYREAKKRLLGSILILLGDPNKQNLTSKLTHRFQWK